jgi:hypothetical protein
MMTLDWQIRSATGQCAACSKAFEDGEPLLSGLKFVNEEGYTRSDFCEPCAGGTPPAGCVSLWRSRYHKPTPPPEEPLKKETAESLLRSLMETEDGSNLNVIFVLAVMLERRRIFAERDVQVREDGAKIRVYEHRKTGETFVVADPQLKLKDLEPVQLEVMQLLGVPPPKKFATAPAPETPPSQPT